MGARILLLLLLLLDSGLLGNYEPPHPRDFQEQGETVEQGLGAGVEECKGGWGGRRSRWHHLKSCMKRQPVTGDQNESVSQIVNLHWVNIAVGTLVTGMI